MYKKTTATIKMNHIRADVMRCAWVLAQEAAEKHGGAAWQYVGGCMRKAWDKIKRAMYRVNDVAMLSSFIAHFAKVYWDKETDTLTTEQVLECLEADNYTPARRYHCYCTEGYAIANLLAYLVKAGKKSGYLDIREPEDIRRKMISDGIGTAEHEQNMKNACDDAASVHGFQGYSWSASYISSWEKRILDSFRHTSAKDASKKCYDAIEVLFETYDITKRERSYLEDTVDYAAELARKEYLVRAAQQVEEQVQEEVNEVSDWIEEAVKLGAKRWTKGAHDRLYLREMARTICCVDIGYYKTGNISHFSINGESHSNAEGGRFMAWNAYYDINAGRLVNPRGNCKWAEEACEAKIKELRGE